MNLLKHLERIAWLTENRDATLAALTLGAIVALDRVEIELGYASDSVRRLREEIGEEPTEAALADATGEP